MGKQTGPTLSEVLKQPRTPNWTAPMEHYRMTQSTARTQSPGNFDRIFEGEGREIKTRNFPHYILLQHTTNNVFISLISQF